MQCEIITIGDELLIGQVVDTNSAWMAERLNEASIELKQITSVHDDAEHIVEAIDAAFTRADIVLTTGGLGPTKDDITKKVLCDYFHTTLVSDETVHQHVLQLYKDRPDVINKLTSTQWLVPQSATILPNRVGSAPIMVFTKGEKILVSMPGVPYEMKIAMTEQVMPYLSAQRSFSTAVLQRSGLTAEGGQCAITHRTALVYAVPESVLAIRLEAWEEALPKTMHLAYLPKDRTVRLRLSGYDVAPEQVEVQFNKMLSILGDDVVLTEDKPLEVALGELLRSRHQTIATAESCTGGKLASLLNKHSGSSDFYWGSVVAYDNSVKAHVLGVQEAMLQEYGAVSEPVVRAMAEGVKKLLKTDYAIATSGVAGPTGGTPDKPVGTVWVAWATPTETFAECLHLGALREQITDRACAAALIKMIKYLHIS